MLITKPTDVRKWTIYHRDTTYGKVENLKELSDGRKGRILGAINTALKKPEGKPDEDRKLVLGWLFLNDDDVFVPLSSKTLTPAAWLSLERWVFGGNDNPRPAFLSECRWIYNHATNDRGARPNAMMSQNVDFWNQHDVPLEMERGGALELGIALPGAQPVPVDNVPQDNAPGAMQELVNKYGKEMVERWLLRY